MNSVVMPVLALNDIFHLIKQILSFLMDSIAMLFAFNKINWVFVSNWKHLFYLKKELALFFGFIEWYLFFFQNN